MMDPDSISAIKLLDGLGYIVIVPEIAREMEPLIREAATYVLSHPLARPHEDAIVERLLALANAVKNR